MYIFKNAMKNLVRNKGRNILVFLILLAVMTAVTTCALIRQAAENEIGEYTRSFQPQVNFKLDYQRLAADFPGKQVTNIDGSVYYEPDPEEPNVYPSDELWDEWGELEEVDHMDCAIVSPYSTDMETANNRSLVQDGDLRDYYGKDLSFFRQMAEDAYNTKKKYYMSEGFVNSKLFETLYKKGHVVTEEEACELAARTVFGDEVWQDYLEHGISDALAETAFDLKMGPYAMETCLEMNPSSGNIMAYTNYDSPYTGFAIGDLSLQDGAFPEEENDCMVSKQFVETNDLAIGDTIQVTCVYKESRNATLTLKITGIYSADAFEATYQDGADALARDIYTTEGTLKQSGFTQYYSDLPIYYLSDVEAVEAFEEKLKENGLSEYLSIIDNIGELESHIRPIQRISQFVTVLMVVVLLLGGAVFLLLTFLAVRERKYEIGVLRLIGMKKKKVIRGFLYETSVIVFVCCALGMLLGTAIAQPVADRMLVQGTEEEAAEDATVDSQSDGMSQQDIVMLGADGSELTLGPDGSVVENIEPVSGLDSLSLDPEQEEDLRIYTHLSVSVSLEMVGAAFVLMLVAVLVAGFYITRFEPMRILANQE